MKLEVGQRFPDFSLKNAEGLIKNLRDYRGKKLILYFYPRDDTSGCAKEACSLRDGYAVLQKAGFAVVGVSSDPQESHRKFKVKYGLPFELLCDEDHAFAEKCGVWVKKSMYGDEYMGIARTTFVIDEKGIILHIIPKVNVDEHTEQILVLVR